MAQSTQTRRTTRAVSTVSTAVSEDDVSILSIATTTATNHTRLPPPYILPPTVPSPFEGTLEASLDAILEMARIHPEMLPLCTILLRDVDRSTDWRFLFTTILRENANGKGRELLEELLFLVTRKLLPEQIAENRDLMRRMYTEKRGYRSACRGDTMCSLRPACDTITPQ
jgi:hypothetical protein